MLQAEASTIPDIYYVTENSAKRDEDSTFKSSLALRWSLLALK